MSNSQYFPPYLTPGNFDNSEINVNLNLTDYATKVDLNNITHVDTSSFASKLNLGFLKDKVDKLDISNLSTVPADLSKLTKEVQEDFTKRTDFSAFEKKVTDNKTEQDNLETKVTDNHLTAESSINDLKQK